MAEYIYKGDLPANIELVGDIAVDTETSGLLIQNRDRLCLVQLSDGRGDAHLVQFSRGDYGRANRLKALLEDANRTKIFHYARFDMAVLKKFLNVDVRNVYCTKIASKLVRTYTDRHGLKELCRELLNIELSKQQQSSDWGNEDLSSEQLKYAASDVIYLHQLREKLNGMLMREARLEIARGCFAFLPIRVVLDLQGWPEEDIFSHS
jgi:ribonuclease D